MRTQYLFFQLAPFPLLSLGGSILQTWNPANSVIVTNLLQNLARQLQPLGFMALVLERVVGCEVSPIESILLVPQRWCRLFRLTGKGVQIGTVKYSILILQNKSPHLVAGLKHQSAYPSGGIHGKIWISIQARGQFIQVILKAAEVRALLQLLASRNVLDVRESAARGGWRPALAGWLRRLTA